MTNNNNWFIIIRCTIRLNFLLCIKFYILEILQQNQQQFRVVTNAQCTVDRKHQINQNQSSTVNRPNEVSK